MSRKIFLFILLILSFNAYPNVSRLKDIISVKGVRENPVVGYGLVIGLNGTGDSGGEVVTNSIKQMLKKLGLDAKQEVSSQNIASVVVTAKLPPFARVGQKIDVVVNSIGDASSLAGGSLLITPLKGGDGEVYAVASGILASGGLRKKVQFPTMARVLEGAIVEKEIQIKFDQKKSLQLGIKNPDFTTSARIEKVINEELGGRYATARDSNTIDLIVPLHYQRKIVQLMAIVENFKINVDQKAKIVINERTGTVVLGGDIQIRPVAISHGDLTIEIKQEENSEESKSDTIYFVDKKTTLKDLVESLNSFGTSPEDLMSIFQALKSNGALIGEIEII